MPEMLKRNGYATHGIGKWHCGYYTWKHTPAQRGFDTFLGFYNGAQDHYTHKRSGIIDFRLNYHTKNGTFVDNLRYDLKGIYNTNIFSDRAVSLITSHNQSQPLFMYLSYGSPHHPIQAPRAEIKRYAKHMKKGSRARRTYAAMISIMDHGIGRVVNALEEEGMRDNTIILFFSDNGAVMELPGSNYPLRGGKHSFQEGGVRSVALVNSPLLTTTGYTNTHLLHVTDWYTTFQALARDQPETASYIYTVN